MADVPAPNYLALGQATQGQNPLQQLGQLVGVQSNMLALQGAKQEFAARQAMGPLAQASINPQTGQMDYAKFATLISSDPRTAWKAPDILNGIVQRELQQSQIIKQGLESGIEVQKLIGAEAAALKAQKGDNVTKADVMEAFARMKGNPAFASLFPNATALSQFIQSLPQDGKPLSNYLNSAIVKAGVAHNNLEMAYGKVNFPETGSQILPVRDVHGELQPGGPAIAKTQTPGEAQGLVETKGPQGETLYQRNAGAVPLAQVPGQVSQYGGGPVAPGASTTTPGGSPHSPASPQESTGGGLKALSPERQALLDAQGETVKNYYKALNADAENANKTLAMAGEVKKILPTISTNPGQSARAEIAAVAKGLGVDEKTVSAINGGSLAGTQIVRKLLAQLAVNSMHMSLESTGGGTATGRYTEHIFKTFQEQNPNIDLEPAAVKEMLSFVEKVARVKQEELKVWNREAAKGVPMHEFASKWMDHLQQSKIFNDAEKGFATKNAPGEVK